jgi:hypothetical protein
VPHAWANALKILVERPEVTDIFRFWPRDYQQTSNGPPWSALPVKLAQAVVNSDSIVWPLRNEVGSAFANIGSVLVDKQTGPQDVHAALAKAGLRLSLVPSDIFQLLQHHSFAHAIEWLTPTSAHKALKVNFFFVVRDPDVTQCMQECIDSLPSLTPELLNIILLYLLGTSDLYINQGQPHLDCIPHFRRQQSVRIA